MLPRDENSDCLEEKVSYEIGESPSMMWKRSIVQAKAGHTGAAAILTLALVVVIALCGARAVAAADLVIEIPGWGAAGAEGAHYRLDYRPPQGSPAPNYTVPARASTINFQGLPGTKYHFMLYYSNATFADLLTWNQTIITAPEPPTNLTVTLGRNKQAAISWSPPAHGDYSGFRFKVIPLWERAEGGARNISVEGAGNWSHVLRDLSPGATYQLHAFTLLHDKESAAYASFNFTTKPNTPGKFIVWFRNETTLLVLWQPPYPPGAYTHYKVSIEPRDARESELYVEKEGEPPGPAQAAFKGLVPGRAYDISVQTVSDDQLSAPTTAQYRTVPLRPRNVTVPARSLAETAFRVTWLPPAELSEFEKYQVSVSAGGAGGAGGRRLPPQLRAREEPPACAFDGLEPGAHYTVTVKTMSGKVTSWPATADLTLKPLPVRDLQGRSVETDEGGGVFLWWKPADGSTQDEYKVSYHETGPSRDDSNTLTTTNTNVTLEALLPGRNYTVTVAAVSRGVESNDSVFQAATRPLAPALRSATAERRALLLAWSSDVNSRQDRYELRYRRRDGDAPYATLLTADTNATLEDLYPGAVYEIQLVAISHGLRSERHTVLKPVRPLPAEWLSVERATSNSVAVRWRGPRAGAVGAFVLRYRTAAAAWRRLEPLPPSADVAEIANMTHGERYEIQLDTASEDAAGETVESGQPLAAEHTVRPNPVSNVAQLADTRNVTLEWPRPAGRVEWYEVRWWASERAGGAAAGAAGGARNVSADGGSRTVRALLGELAPGRGYSVSIAAHSHELASDIFTMHTRTRPLIQSEMTIVNESGDGDDNDTSPAILVIYTPTPSSASKFDAYRFRLEGGDAPARWQERPATPPDTDHDAAGQQQVAFRSLTPGRLYNLTMWTVSRNVTSHPVQRQARLYPRPITELNATSVGAREISLAWARPAGDFTDFEVQYLVDEDRLETRTTDRLALTLTDLRPYTLYVFTVVVQAGTPATILTRSRARSGSFRTLEAPPAAPTRFQLIDATPTELAFEWALPARDAHGVLTRFRIYVAPAGAAGEAARWVEFPGSARAGRVGGLAAGGEYELWLRAATGAGEGEAARVRQRMAIAAPPRPTAQPAEVRRSSTTVAVSFGADYFSPANGNVTAYTLVLAEEPRADTPARLPSWRDVHRLPVWPPYQVTEPYYPFRSAAVEEFTIGSERCEGGGRSYCNGPLKPGSRYYVKLRAFTAPDKFTDTAYTVVYTEADNTGWIAGGAVCGALAAALLAGALLLRRPRRAPRARRRLRRPLPPHVGRLRLQVQRGVRGAEARRPRAAVHGGRPALQPPQEPLHQHPAVRPLALQAAAGGRRGGLRLHQRQLRARAQLPARVHRDAGPAALHARRLLAHVLGVGLARHRDVDALRGEGPREVRPLLALRHAARVLRRHRRDGAQREPLPRLDRDGAGRLPRRRAARAAPLPLHHVARLRRARPAHGAGALRARLPRALPARHAARHRALQRRRGPLGHLYHAGPRAAAAGRARRVPGHLRHGARHAARTRVDGADGAAVHLHPPVRGGGAGGRGPGAAAAQQPPPQRRLRRRRGHRRVGHVTPAVVCALPFGRCRSGAGRHPAAVPQPSRSRVPRPKSRTSIAFTDRASYLYLKLFSDSCEFFCTIVLSFFYEYAFCKNVH